MQNDENEISLTGLFGLGCCFDILQAQSINTNTNRKDNKFSSATFDGDVYSKKNDKEIC